jgi:predicted flap endonuclease-1-like 5' DNA nuclease|tara:strand:- start:922 stop:1521 length:600 start_codon:yes stop_codon:yes gene_type:complete
MLKLFLLFTFPTQFFGIFVLMFSTFLIGYFTSLWLEATRNKTIIRKLKRKINNLKQDHNVSGREKKNHNIDTVFTEIEPKYLNVAPKEQKQIVEEKSSKKAVANKARTSYITYTKTKTELDSNNFSEALENQNDDLTKLDGVGPYIEQRLNDIGIYNYEQVSNLNTEDIHKITELIDFFPGRIERDNWVGQAQLFKINT